MMRAGPSPEPLGEPDRGQSHEHGDGRKTIGLGIAAELHELEDGERERLGLSRDVTRDHDRRAELAEGARERENEASKDPAEGERQAHRNENTERALSERARDGFEARIDIFERRPHRTGKRNQR